MSLCWQNPVGPFPTLPPTPLTLFTDFLGSSSAAMPRLALSSTHYLCLPDILIVIPEFARLPRCATRFASSQRLFVSSGLFFSRLLPCRDGVAFASWPHYNTARDVLLPVAGIGGYP